MSKHTTIIQMYTAADTDAAASIDVPDDGVLLACGIQAHGSLFAADGDGFVAEVSFGSTNSNLANDARQVISSCAIFADLIGAAATMMRSEANTFRTFGDGVRVSAGERIYLHITDYGSGVNLHTWVHLYLKLVGEASGRRR